MSRHPFVSERSLSDSSVAGRTLQEARRGEEVCLTLVKLDGPNFSWLDTTIIYGVEEGEDSEVCLLFHVCFLGIFQLFFFFYFFRDSKKTDSFSFLSTYCYYWLTLDSDFQK